MRRLLIVGTGLTASSLSFLVSRVTRPELLQVTVWDKARGSGGRMASARSNRVPGCSVDLGAQFFSITPEYANKHRELYDLLLSERVLMPLAPSVENEREFPEGTEHYVAPAGSVTIPKFFLNRSRADVNFRHQLFRIDLSPTTGRWTINGQSKMPIEVDAIVLTMPVPQALTLKGNFLQLIDDATMNKLRRVDYSPRYALGMFYEPGTVLPGDWIAKYISNNPTLRFIAKDHLKRGQHKASPSVVVQTSALFGLQAVDAPPSDVQGRLLEELKTVLPGFPTPVEMKLHKWRYSQVYQEYEDQPGCLLINSQPPLILAGDAFSHTNINGTITSAKAALDQIVRSMPDVVSENLPDRS